jgi:uncharacterized protein YodC (DUF2158 family)
MSNETKLYFLPGDVVTIKQEIPNKPIMYVVKKITKTIKTNTTINDYFQGILCRWFTLNLELQESVFNTKDLLHINK